jgi:tRNA threonylcarbamoyladenosine biosynthesis protein TsaB
MIWLAMDTSTTTLALAVMRDGKCLASYHDRAERNHSIRLVPAVEEVLAEAGVTKQQVDAIAVGRGPGSYTGVRIAATVGKTYAWALGIPIVGVSSLAALALSAALENESEWLVPVMNARRGQAYTGLYERFLSEHGQVLVRELEPDANRMAEPWFSAIQTEKSWCVVGETDAFVDALQTSGAAAQYSEMNAVAVGLLAQARFAAGGQDVAHDFVPNYTQLAEAEVNWLANQKR